MRFFAIASQLPLELQMVLCHRAFGSRKDLILIKHSEPAFKKLTRYLLVNAKPVLVDHHQLIFGVGVGVGVGALLLCGGLVLMTTFLLRGR